MKPILTAIAILAATVVHIISGSALISIGRSHASLFKEADCKLPLISELSTNYTATTAPIIVGLLLGYDDSTWTGIGFSFPDISLVIAFPPFPFIRNRYPTHHVCSVRNHRSSSSSYTNHVTTIKSLTSRSIQPLGAALFTNLYDNYNLNPAFDACPRS